jgi:hypothetical protein
VTTLVLVILGGIWAAVIIVPLVRARTEGTLGDSIGTFRRHLSVLERAGPTSVNPANRLRTQAGQSTIPPYRRPTTAGSARGWQGPVTGPSGRRPGSPRSSAAAVQRRRQLQRRRRDVLFTLLAAMAASLLLSMIHGLHVMLVVHIVFDLLFVVYVALLIRMRNVSAEREMKVTFLPGAGPVRGLAARASGSAAEARAAAYGDGAEYGLPAGY